MLARDLAKYLKAKDILCLFGDLGSGKTTFTKGLAQGLGIKAKEVNSPTFVLLNIYEGRCPLYHFDLYRMDNVQEILNIGYEEFLYDEGIAVIEWADKLKELIPEEYLKIEFRYLDEKKRSIKISSYGKRYKKLLKKIENLL